MTTIEKLIKDLMRPRKRRAISGALVPILLIVIVIAAIGVVASQFFDLSDTASIVDAIELSSPAIYSDQGFVTIQIKNNGNTVIDDIYGTVLVSATPAGANCPSGTIASTIGTANIEVETADLPDLDPGESVTLSGSVIADTDGLYDGTTMALAVCTGFDDRSEYIIQVHGESDGDDISKTIPIRAR